MPKLQHWDLAAGLLESLLNRWRSRQSWAQQQTKGKFLQWLRERGITPYMRTRVSIVLDAQQDLRGRFGSLLPSSLQRRVLRLGLFQDGNVGVFPECEKVFVLRERPGAGGTGIRTL